MNQSSPTAEQNASETIPVIEATEEQKAAANLEADKKLLADMKAQLAQLEADKRVVVEFKNAVFDGSYHGKHSTAIAVGLNFLSAVILQGSERINALLTQIQKLEKAMK